MFVVIFFVYLMFNHSIALNHWIIKLMAFTVGLTYQHTLQHSSMKLVAST